MDNIQETGQWSLQLFPSMHDGVVIILLKNALERFACLRNTDSQDRKARDEAVTELAYVVSIHHYLSTEHRSLMKNPQGLVGAIGRLCSQPLKNVLKDSDLDIAFLLFMIIGDGDVEAITHCIQDQEDDAGSNETSTYPSSFLADFLRTLRNVWGKCKCMFDVSKWSPMPWSARSRREGLPPPPYSYHCECSMLWTILSA